MGGLTKATATGKIEWSSTVGTEKTKFDGHKIRLFHATMLTVDGLTVKPAEEDGKRLQKVLGNVYAKRVNQTLAHL